MQSLKKIHAWAQIKVPQRFDQFERIIFEPQHEVSNNVVCATSIV